MSLIDDIKRDREAGTPGPWRIKDCDSMGDRCTHYYQEVWNDETDILVTTEVTRAHNDGGRVNMRRIARVPDLEAALLAAEGCANWCDALIEMVQATSCAPEDPEAFDEVAMGAQMFLAAYRKATEAAE